MSKPSFEIKADAKSVSEILHTKKYEIDVFQREYMWQRKQMEDLIDDLTSKFLSVYESSHERDEVQNYPRYYLGSIILSIKEGGRRSIIDGQQRLTSITLLLIFLKNLQNSRTDAVNITDLIVSERFAQKTYNLLTEDRKESLEALYNDRQEYDYTGKGDSVKNIVERYRDIEELFPTELKDEALPFFVDWLIEKVIFVIINTYSDEAHKESS